MSDCNDRDQRSKTQNLRTLVEMAYLFAWGADGGSTWRDSFRQAFSAVKKEHGTGDFMWDAERFLWMDEKEEADE